MQVNATGNIQLAHQMIEQTCLSMMETLSADKQTCVALLQSALMSSLHSQQTGQCKQPLVNNLTILSEQESSFIRELFH